MNSPILTALLKQHTPILHFQALQKGACLRATEVKPKLDEFLLKKLGGGESQKGAKIAIEKGWCIGQKTEKGVALNYKLSIRAKGEQEWFLPLAHHIRQDKKESLIKGVKKEYEKCFSNIKIIAPSPFFGNMDKIKFDSGTADLNKKRSNLKELIFGIKAKGGVELSFFVLNRSLKKLLEKHLPEFFLTTNFGMRQNKGFGSFTVSKINNRPASMDSKDEEKHFFAKDKSSTHPFSFIQKQYQLLKSGINHNGYYQKPYLFQYFAQKGIPWEKRFLKKWLKQSGIELKGRDSAIDFSPKTIKYQNTCKDEHQQKSYKFIRALLGLPEEYIFQKEHIVKVRHSPKEKTGSQIKIERFKSPLFFKVINGRTYLRFDKSYEILLSERFEFSHEGITSPVYLRVPDAFSIKNFLENCLTRCQNSPWEKIS